MNIFINNKNRLAFLLISLFFGFLNSIQLNAQDIQQQKYVLSGYVEDKNSGERLIGVSIQVLNESVGTITNNYGFFSLSIPKSNAIIRFAYLGFATIDTTFLTQGDMDLVLKMDYEMGELEGVTITAKNTPNIQESNQMSKISISAAQIQSMPRFFGEADLMKTLQMMPGVQQGSEGTSALLVRGGSPDQNLILLDGAPLYNPSHMLGIFSTFNTNIIKNVDLYKGAFPARFGGRLSSVVDISTKDGNMKKLKGDISVGILASQITLEGPIMKDKTTFVLSGRRTYGDIFAAPLIKMTSDGNATMNMYFYDFNVKLQHRFSDNDRLFISFYGGKDKFGIKQKYDFEKINIGLGWGNYTGTIRWNHAFSNKLFSNVTLLASDYSMKMQAGFEYSSLSDNSSNTASLHSGIRDIGGKVDFDYYPHHAHKIKTGFGFVNHKFTPGTSRFQSDENGQTIFDIVNDKYENISNEVNVYVEDDWNISKRLSANIGLHWSGFNTQNKFYNYIQPRISGRYLLPGDVGLKVSYARMAQYLHLLSGNSITLPTDLWVPATDNIRPQVANQYALGLARSIWKDQLEVSIEGYYKKMENVIEYKDGSQYIVISSDKSWEDQIASGNGLAYGTELMIEKKAGKLTGWMAYTLSKTERTISDVNFGRTFPYKYDRLHDFKLVTTYKISSGIEISGCWIYQSPTPFTMALGDYEGVENNEEPPIIIENITSRNNVRIEPYHRLDLSLSFIKTKNKGQIRTWNISVYNVYNRHNPFMYYVQRDSRNNANVMRLSMLPILPSISYSLKF